MIVGVIRNILTSSGIGTGNRGYVRIFFLISSSMLRFLPWCRLVLKGRNSNVKTRYLCARFGHSSDGFEKSATKIVSNVLDHVRPGSIVIFHMHGGPNAPETAN